MNPIEIAELSQIDDDTYTQLTTLIIKTWEYDDWLEDDQVSPMAEYFFNDIILSSQKIYVVRSAQQIIGIIIVGQSSDFLYESQFSYKRLMAMSALIVRNGKREVFTQLSPNDLMIILLTVWWYAMPEILKKHIDRFWNHGITYGAGSSPPAKNSLGCLSRGDREGFY
ncbi:Putative NADPH-quinone reductase (modulator of drug activity B) [Edwardsiella tarda]|nr:Putative NADPH-quinone reductase (modulator of drug activity B) [Edwardsiella tarda]